MACILFQILRICHCQFKCNYLKNEKLFLYFLFHFWNLHQILNILKETMIVKTFFQIWEKIFCFSDNSIWIWSVKFSQSWTLYLACSVNVLTNTAKISPNTKGDILQIRSCENDEKTWKKSFHQDFGSVCNAFPCWLSKRALKWRLLESVLTKFSIVCSFGNTLGMTIIFSFKMFKIWCRFQKWNKKLKKSFSFFR